MKKIAVVTATRAEYGILKPLIQKILAETVIQSKVDTEDILEAMQKASRMKHSCSKLYGDGDTSGKIMKVIKDFLDKDKIDLKKKFYDVEFQ